MLKPRHGWIALTVLVVELATGVMLLRPRATANHTAFLSVSSTADDSVRRQLIGTWSDNYQAVRTLTIREDGSATMTCRLQGLHRLFATQLVFEQKWHLDGDRLTFKTLRGEPQKKVDFVVKLKGDTFRQTLLSVTETELHVFDETEATEFHWQRAPSESSDDSQLLAQADSEDPSSSE